MMNYGRTLDARDFAGFAELFARDGEYVAGASTAKGPAAIRELLEGLLKKNAAPVPGRDFHLFFNETIEVNGNEADRVEQRRLLRERRGPAAADERPRELPRSVRARRRQMEVQARGSSAKTRRRLLERPDELTSDRHETRVWRDPSRQRSSSA